MNAETLKELLSDATPGPWYVDENNPNDFPSRYQQDNCTVMAYDCDYHTLADCSCNHTCRGDNEVEANAKLIALAPELAADNIALQAEVERLRKALREISAGIFNDNGDVTSIGMLAIERIARAALRETQEI